MPMFLIDALFILERKNNLEIQNQKIKLKMNKKHQTKSLKFDIFEFYLT